VTPRESVLLQGLIDWVPLDRVHSDVARSNEGSPLSVVQSKTLELIQSLVGEGLFELGGVTASDGFIRWDRPLSESIKRIEDVYITNFEDRNVWPWFCWLNLTDKGQHVAEDIESRSQSRPEQ
jgi:hypothetical protein